KPTFTSFFSGASEPAAQTLARIAGAMAATIAAVRVRNWRRVFRDMVGLPFVRGSKKKRRHRPRALACRDAFVAPTTAVGRGRLPITCKGYARCGKCLIRCLLSVP